MMEFASADLPLTTYIDELCRIGNTQFGYPVRAWADVR